ncbi:EAL domain-containing protein [Chitinimonas koreensis]|uniref:EAL domain-containing protein n=1 Tax=Chitinimonas koreensis TaxID=356302 RepID=UPI0003FB58C4|nr:EAL domain-containing protein [Chitinimonas koreensis]QNM95480.1 EAL domain-containing protein [Chitinimonas koreensis]
MVPLLYPVYQPIVDLRTGEPLHYEALARVALDTSGVAHGPLIELAERFRFIPALDLSIASQVLETARIHAAHVAINLSPVTIETATQQLLEQLDVEATLACRLTIEITEQQPIQDLGLLLDFLEIVRGRHISVALDDFGRGCFTEPLVRRIQPDFLKIDGSLLERSVRGHGSEELRRAVDLVAGFGGRLIAEFVDSPRKAIHLGTMGIHYAQGSLFGMPSAALPDDQPPPVMRVCVTALQEDAS